MNQRGRKEDATGALVGRPRRPAGGRYLPTYLALALLAALGLYVTLTGPSGQDPTSSAGGLLGLRPEEVQAVEVTWEGETARVELEGDAWTLTSPLRWQADSSTVEALLTEAGRLSPLHELGSVSEGREEYGLDEPSLRAVLYRNDGEPVALEFGDTTPVGDGYYMAVAGRPEVYVIDSRAVERFQVSASDLREHRLLVFDNADVRELRVERAGEPALHLAREGSGWRLLSPVEDEADSWRADDLVWDLRTLRAEAFYDEPQDEAAYGLDRPRAVIELALGDGDGTRHVLQVGAEGEEADTFYARVEGRDTVYLVRRASFGPLEQRVEDLLRADLWQGGTEPASLRVALADRELVLARDGETWRDRAGEAVPAEAVDELLRAAAAVRASGVRVGLDEAAAGLDDPVLLLEADSAGEASRLALGRPGDGVTYASASGRPHVYPVGDDGAEALLEAARGLWPAEG